MLFNSINAFIQNIIIDISAIISKDIREHIIIYSIVLIYKLEKYYKKFRILYIK